jgi:menaquinone-9 beta-reductase
MLKACLIIGGGIAGLSAAIRLTELGIQPLVIEAGKYPSHRLCGEFFSPESLPLIKRWQMPQGSQITKCCFFTRRQHLSFELPQPAVGSSHYIFDWELLQLAKSKGVEVLTETRVTDILPAHSADDFHHVYLENSNCYQTKQLIIGTGRLPTIIQGQPLKPRYFGFKSHFEGLDLDSTLKMFCFPGGYLGISSVAPNVANVAGLIRLNDLDNEKPLEFIQKQSGFENLVLQLRSAKPLLPEWMKGTSPEFGIRQTPLWPNTYWIGDAAGSLPPICGDGIGMALTSGAMAAEYLAQNDAQAFKKAWLKRYQKRFFWAKCLHKIVINPTSCTLAVLGSRLIPSLPKKVFELTREHV